MPGKSFTPILPDASTHELREGDLVQRRGSAMVIRVEQHFTNLASDPKLHTSEHGIGGGVLAEAPSILFVGLPAPANVKHGSFGFGFFSFHLRGFRYQHPDNDLAGQLRHLPSRPGTQSRAVIVLYYFSRPIKVGNNRALRSAPSPPGRAPDAQVR